MATRTIPFFASFINKGGGSTATTKQLLTNCYPEINKNSISGKVTVNLLKREGFAAGTPTPYSYIPTYGNCVWFSNSSAASPVVNGWTNAPGGGTIRFYSAQAPTTQIGGDITAANGSSSITETSISGVGNLVANCPDNNNEQRYYFFPEGGAWTQITDVDFPLAQTPALVTTGAPVHMDGYMFIMCTNGQIWNSDLNSLANWSAASFITAQSYPDGGCALARYKDMIVAFGLGSIEFFKNVGNPTGSPLQRINGATLNIGSYARASTFLINTVKAIGDTVYFIGRNTTSGRNAIYRLNGMEAEKISTPAVDKILEGSVSSSVFAGIAGSVTLHGMQHVVFVSAGGTGNFCYCVETGIWWNLTNPYSYIYSAVGYAGTSYITIASTSNFYSFSPTLFQDAGGAYTATFLTAPLDEETTNRKFVYRLRIIGDTQSATSNLAVSYSDDDQVTYSTARNIDLSSQNKELTRLGSHKYRRSWKFTHSANTDCRLQYFELERNIGTS